MSHLSFRDITYPLSKDIEMDSITYDVFISYSSQDRKWVREELLKQLEARGLKACIDFRDFQRGAPIVKEIERALQTSRKTLLVLTPAYLESRWTELESLILQTIDPANRDLRLIPLLKEKSYLPPRIRYLTYVDFTTYEDLDIAWTQLLTALGGRELAAAFKEGFNAIKGYTRAKAVAQIALNEAKLILIGEGEVGKSCLLGALRGDEWIEGRPTTHGIEVKPIVVTDPDTGKEITLNGWDFGGQRVYRPTHQLFFSAPAVYLVVWKPREGSQQGFVKEWIRLVKHREPEAKIIVVATHGGPGQRQPDIDKQEIWGLFGKDTVIDFFHVDSKPDTKTGEGRGISELKYSIARVASKLAEMGRSVPKSWQEAHEVLQQTGAAYLSLERVLEICRECNMNNDEARLFVTISHRLGHLIHYAQDSVLQNIVILKPDWLATAISFVLDDKQTREDHGLVSFFRLGELWNDPAREKEFQYPPSLHPVFLRLMERFDLSYRAVGLQDNDHSDETSLIAQLVPDVRPDLVSVWADDVAKGDGQQVQICRIVEKKTGQSAAAEGLFYQLIVRLHKYSLGRVNRNESIHWQRGLLLDDDYNGRALLEHVGNDVRITVRAPYPERFLSVLTYEVKWLVENFWAGLRCEVMVPCIMPCGNNAPGTGLFEVQKLIESKRQKRPEYPCPACNEWQSIDFLLRNAPSARPIPIADELFTEFAEVKDGLIAIRKRLIQQHGEALGRFDRLDISTQRILSQVDDAFTKLMQALTDEAKDGPRLFSLVPVKRTAFNPKEWTGEKFRLTLWCEHSRLPLSAPKLNGEKDKRGVYELELTREWFKKAAPFLKVLTGTLSLVLPVASSAVKLALDDAAYKVIEEDLDLGQKCIEATLGGGEKIGEWLGSGEAADLEHGEAIRARGSVLRELHSLLKEKDPGFGGLVRVQNKRQEFLWVHERFEEEY
jgi:internalin A